MLLCLYFTTSCKPNFSNTFTPENNLFISYYHTSRCKKHLKLWHWVSWPQLSKTGTKSSNVLQWFNKVWYGPRRIAPVVAAMHSQTSQNLKNSLTWVVLLYPRPTKLKGDILVSPGPSIRLWTESCPLCIFTGSISYLHTLSSNFKRCVTCNFFFKIKQFEVLAIF